MIRVVVRHAAQADVKDAAAWYAQEDPGLASRFAQECRSRPLERGTSCSGQTSEAERMLTQKSRSAENGSVYIVAVQGSQNGNPGYA